LLRGINLSHSFVSLAGDFVALPSRVITEANKTSESARRDNANSESARDRVGEIETEGLGIMAKDMGVECWGLPDLEIGHAPQTSGKSETSGRSSLLFISFVFYRGSRRYYGQLHREYAMEQSRVFRALCHHLRHGLLEGWLPAWYPWIGWEQLMEVSRGHYVAPALAWCLKDKPLPTKVSQQFRAISILNEKRNEKLLDTVARVAAALNAIDIEPVLLKGAAHLVEGIYPAIGLRMVGDLDLLVPEDQVIGAAAALQKIGFKFGSLILPENHHHWRMLFDPITEAGVELHIGALHRRSEHLMPVSEFFENARTVAFRGLLVRIPDPTRAIGHNIVHCALDHDGHLHRRLDLRQLLDLAMIRRKHESAIDWARLDSCFAVAAVGHVLATNLKIAEDLFGLAVPRIVHVTERHRKQGTVDGIAWNDGLESNSCWASM